MKEHLMRYAFTYLLAMIAALGGGCLIRGRAQSLPTYSVTYHESAKGADGSRVDYVDHLPDHYVGQRADGAHISIWPMPHDPDVKGIAIDYPAKGIGIDRNSRNLLMTVSGIGTPRVIQPPDATCSQYGKNGVVEQLLGFRVLHFKEDSALVTEDRWRAPDLGCVDLKVLNVWKREQTGEYDGAWTLREAIAASAEPPADELFVIPVGSQDVTPSQYQLSLHPGMLITPKLAERDAMWEKQYKIRQESGITY